MLQRYLHAYGSLSLRLIAAVAVGVTGTILLQYSHALDTSGSDFQTAVHQASTLPTVAASSCCQISVSSYSTNTTGDLHASVQVKLTNTSAAIVQISPGLQFWLADTAGHLHDYTAAYLPAGQTAGGPIAPGSTRSEEYDFSLNAQDIPAFLAFQQDAASKPVFVGLPR